MGAALSACPDLNGWILWGRFNRHETVDLSCLVNIAEAEGRNDLAVVKISDVANKTVVDIFEELRTNSEVCCHDECTVHVVS